MKKSKFTDQQIAYIVRQQEQGLRVKEICRQHGISQPTFYVWKSRRVAAHAERTADYEQIQQLEDELMQYKRIVAEQQLYVTALKDQLRACTQSQGEQSMS